ncbi:MBL fold metallo-hydrolase [Candidatus Saccharibacteria bacterium]|nr:MBL fold metallo-hydrolase [Candidatus Saccharibacteria bacterium]
MKLTKHEHSCMVVENEGQALVIDPGALAELPMLENVVAVVITHVHADHLSVENLVNLAQHNPNMKLFAAPDMLAEVSGLGVEVESVGRGHTETATVGSFKLEFGGQDHAVIYEKVPCQNASLLVNDILFYPGDSFTLPPRQVKVLAVPASAPWMKTSEAMDYIKACKSEIVVPVHDGLLSDFGKKVTHNWLQQACEAVNSRLTILNSNESVDVV